MNPEDLIQFEANQDSASDLAEIKGKMLELLEEARQAVSGTCECNAAESYWVSHIRMALDNEHQYLGGSMHTMQDTIDELEDSSL